MSSLLQRLPVIGRWFPEALEPPATWQGVPGGPRVLIEEEDGDLRAAMARTLREAGYQTAECAGPGPGATASRRCPLVEGKGCAAVHQADVVLQVFVASDTAMTEVRRAIVEEEPGTPVTVVAPALVAEKRAADLAGATVSSRPLTARGVVASVAEVVGPR